MKSGAKRKTTPKFEVYMRIKDRKRLARLIEIQEVSKRAVARAAGWKSHTYLLRLLNGEATTCEPIPAMKIAAFLQVDVGDLFLTRTTSDLGQIDQGRAA